MSGDSVLLPWVCAAGAAVGGIVAGMTTWLGPGSSWSLSELVGAGIFGFMFGGIPGTLAGIAAGRAWLGQQGSWVGPALCSFLAAGMVAGSLGWFWVFLGLGLNAIARS